MQTTMQTTMQTKILSRTAIADNLLPALLAIVLTTTLIINSIQLRNCWQARSDETSVVELVDYEPIEQAPKTTDTKLVVTAPKTASVGQLIEVSANTRSSIKFVVKGVDPSNIRVLDHSVVFASPAASTVDVFVAAMLGEALVVEHVTVQVGGSRPLTPTTLRSEIAPLIESVESEDKLKELKDLSAAFKQVAVLIKDGSVSSVEDAVRITKTLVKQATSTAGDAWRKVIDRIQVDAEKAADAGKLKSLEDHARHWEGIAAALDP